MLIERELFADTFSASEELTANGLPKAQAFNSHLGAGWGPFWSDPLGKDLGDGSKYFKYDPGEAKKLIAAAGLANGIDATFYTLATGQYGTTWHNQMEVLTGMTGEGGLRFKTSLEDYSTTYIPKYHYSKGAFNGMSASPGGVRSDPGQFLQIFYHSGGSATRTPAGKAPELDSLVDKQLRELDRRKRIELTHDIEQYLATHQIAVSYGYQAQSYGLTWPWVGNAGVYRAWVVGADAAEITPFLWFDASKKPV
jgi:ABC-type transport system substrate-binding protein